jgi:hypothetical protein
MNEVKKEWTGKEERRMRTISKLGRRRKKRKRRI